MLSKENNESYFNLLIFDFSLEFNSTYYYILGSPSNFIILGTTRIGVLGNLESRSL